MSSSDGLGIDTLIIDDEDGVCMEKVKEKRRKIRKAAGTYVIEETQDQHLSEF
jgi:citrate lyase beta subunit